MIPDFLAKKISNEVSKTEGLIYSDVFSNLVDLDHHYQDVSILFADIKGFTGEHKICMTLEYVLQYIYHIWAPSTNVLMYI